MPFLFGCTNNVQPAIKTKPHIYKIIKTNLPSLFNEVENKNYMKKIDAKEYEKNKNHVSDFEKCMLTREKRLRNK